jgi:hypothetical protein
MSDDNVIPFDEDNEKDFSVEVDELEDAKYEDYIPGAAAEQGEFEAAGGVTIPTPEPEEEEPKGPSEATAPVLPKVPDRFDDKPSIPDQALSAPDTLKFGSIHTRVFDLCKQEHQEEYDRLMSLTLPLGSPSIRVLRNKTEFSTVEGTFKVLFQYQSIQYKKFNVL